MTEDKVEPPNAFGNVSFLDHSGALAGQQANPNQPAPTEAEWLADEILENYKQDLMFFVACCDRPEKVAKLWDLPIGDVQEYGLRELKQIGGIRKKRLTALFEKLDKGEGMDGKRSLRDVMQRLSDIPAERYRKVLSVWKDAAGAKKSGTRSQGKWVALSDLVNIWLGESITPTALQTEYKRFKQKRANRG